ncbi:M56 family metallopeptidase [Pseudidiomarina sp. E22-M8]|uniref:M56 family metallopeptidase n=1 Tax=Pseudidiomarina sp. E22-M8 TaxID=3424768 RepID=UPI00403C61A3
MLELLVSVATLMALVVFTSVVTVEVAIHLWLRYRPKKQLSGAALLSVTFLPLWSALLVFLALGFSFTGKAFGLIKDHCLEHGLGHLHLCFEHLSAQQSNSLTLALLSIMLGVAGLKVLRVFQSLDRHLQLNRQLSGIQSSFINWVDTPNEMAFVSGILKPRIYLSRRLVERLDSKTLRMIVAHEIQHVRNRDVPKMWGIELILALYRQPTRRFLRAAWVQRREQRIDHQLAQRFGRAAVAESLLAMVRVAPRDSVLNSNGGKIEQRLHSLLVNKTNALTKLPYGSVFALIAILGLLIAFQHHALETFIGWIN